MLPQLRHSRIISLLQVNEIMSVEDLAKELSVSPMTVRRDLNLLQDQHLLERTFGAAFLKKQFAEDRDYAEKIEYMTEEKQRIAKYTMSLVKDNMSVMLDAGTTTMAIAKYLPSFSALTVITNDLLIGQYLSGFPHIALYLAGGRVSQKTRSCNDPLAVDFIHNFNVDISFVGCNAFDTDMGAATPSMDKAHMKRAIMSAGEICVLVVDSSKYNKKSMSKIADLNAFDYIVTNDPFNELAKEKHRIEGLNCIYV